MSSGDERAVAIPYAFDAGIGYWTGELDWDLLADALVAAGESLAAPVPAAPLRAWLAAAAGAGVPFQAGAVTLRIEAAQLRLSGDPAAVEALARRIEGHLRCG